MCCLFRVCCDGDEFDDDEQVDGINAPNDDVPMRMTRQEGTTSSATTDYQVVATAMDVENAHGEPDRDDSRCCQPRPNENGQVGRINGFLRKLQESWRKYDSLETFSPETVSFRVHSEHQENEKTVASPLRTALKFDLTKDSAVPTIRPEEVVLPGSSLQKEMSQAMSLNLGELGDECVICMESFDASNPRMPTLCGCGENRTYFHLPCLYQWVEQSSTCPSCRQRLCWEEF
ncbi:hypothetical protein ACA910_016628 [Epithemia clementina (nom. ined.)]